MGAIDTARPPALTVVSGDEVLLSTWTAWGNAVTDSTTLSDVLRLRSTPGLLGPHSLTGPIAVEGAAAGDVLRVDLLELLPAAHGYNLFLPRESSRGILAERFPEGGIRHFKLDPHALTAELLPGLDVRLRPFLGIVGVAPSSPGCHPSAIPGPFGGNIDLRDLVAGTSLRLPVFQPGALLYLGDGHACQGDGEVDQNALETAMPRVRVRLTIERGRSLRAPQAETPTHLITMGFHEDLGEAARLATEEAVDLLAERRGVDPADAYVLCSVAVDLAVTQVVNGKKGVHARIPKELATPKEPKRR